MAGAAVSAPLAPPPGAVDLGWGGRLQVNGMDADVRLFQSGGTPWVVASDLVRSIGGAPWILPMPDGVMLMGTETGQTWLAQLRAATPGGTRGMLASTRSDRRRTDPVMPPWVPAGSVPLLDMRGEEDGQAVVQSIYRHAGSARSLTRLLHGRLRLSGWRPEAAADTWSSWTHEGRRLQIVVVASGGGSGLLAVEHAIDTRGRK